MLSLKCVICLDILRISIRQPFTAPCGHIYCSSCISTISQSRNITNCAICRSQFPISNAIKLFVEESHSPSRALSPPLNEDQRVKLRNITASCDEIGEEVNEEEVKDILMRAEKLVVDLYQSHGESDVEDLLKSLTESLEGMRKRLQLFSRINSLQTEVEYLKEERDTLQKLTAQLQQTITDGSRTEKKLAKRIKQATSDLQAQQAQERQNQMISTAELEQLKAELQDQKSRAARYEKKYHTAVQELKALKSTSLGPRVQRHTSSRENDFVDDSLEIIPPGEIPKKI